MHLTSYFDSFVDRIDNQYFIERSKIIYILINIQ